VEWVKVYRNDIFKALAKSSLDRTECRLDSGDDWIGVMHAPTRSEIRITLAPKTYPGPEHYRVRGTVTDGPVIDWLDVIWSFAVAQVTEWANSVQETIGDPDFWGEAQRNKEIIASAHLGAAGNTPFNPSELTEVAGVLREIQNYIEKSTSLSSAQISRMETSLNEAEEASRRIGRKDWILLFSGTIFSLIVADILTPRIAQDILLFVIQGLGHLFGVGGPPPQIPPGT
jgi:hypothetical protein